MIVSVGIFTWQRRNGCESRAIPVSRSPADTSLVLVLEVLVLMAAVREFLPFLLLFFFLPRANLID